MFPSQPPLGWLWNVGLIVAALSFSLTAITSVALIGLYLLYRRLRVKDFGQRAVFVTGADKGLGRSIVHELEKRGLTVFAGCHSQATATKLKTEVSSKVHPLVIEVTDRNSVIKAREFIQANLPPSGLWGLVNNAGIARGIVFDFARADDYRQVLDVNFFGTMNVTEEFLPLIKKSRGRVVNMISIMGRFSGVAGPYSCSKFALEAYTDGLRRSLKFFGVKVSAIEPGFFKTKMTERLSVEEEVDRLWKTLPADVQQDYGLQSKLRAVRKVGDYVANPPLSQWNTLEGVARAVLHSLRAVNPKAHYVCGWDANLLYRWAALIPDCLVDALFPYISPFAIYVPPSKRKPLQEEEETEEITSSPNQS